MRIESLIRRPRGTIVEFEGKSYDFQPDEHGRHIADVDSDALVEVLLNIPEGYALADPKDSADPEQDPASEQEPKTDLEAVEATPDMPREDLMALYEQKFGEKPHPSIKVETLVKRINEPVE